MSTSAIPVVLSMNEWNDVAAALGREIRRSGKLLLAMRGDPLSDPDDIDIESERVTDLQTARAAIVAAVRAEAAR